MKASVIVAAVFAASVNGAVLDARQRPRTTTRPAEPSVPDGIAPPAHKRNPQTRSPIFSIGNPTVSVSLIPNDPPDLVKCGLDGFVGHTSQALSMCSQILKGGTSTQTVTTTTREVITTKTTVWTTLYPPSSTRPTSTRRPPTSSPPSSTSTKPSSTSRGPEPTAACGLVGYTGSVAAYYFDSSGTKNTWAACSAACKADTKCKSFGYGEANCLLFDVTAAGNTNINPMSPYTFYDVQCPKELPVRKRQITISLDLPEGPISACMCLIGSGSPDKITTTTVVSSTKSTTTQTVTRTVSVLPGDGDRRKSIE